MKRETKMLFGILAIAVGLILVTISLGNRASIYAPGSQQKLTLDKQPDSQQIVSTTRLGLISIADLNSHNQDNDCWVAYNGKVYDITSWLPRHPGSAETISPYCGTASEFEQAFTQQHGTRFASLLMKVGSFIGDFDTKGVIG